MENSTVRKLWGHLRLLLCMNILLLALTATAGGAAPARACDVGCDALIDKLPGATKTRRQSVVAEHSNAVVFQYGTGIPVLKCHPLNVCTVQLQPGETPIEDLTLGDTDLWSAELRLSGTAVDPLVRVAIRPDAAATQTSLLISTNRRFYDIQLVRSNTEYTPVMAFTYPEEDAAAVRAGMARDSARLRADIATLRRFADRLDTLSRVARTAPAETLRQRLPMGECRESVLAPLCDEFTALFAPEEETDGAGPANGEGAP